MALITDYDSLRSEAVSYAWRKGDTEFAESVDNMIQMAGSRFNRKLKLRVMDVDTPLTGTVSSRLIALPTDYVEPFALRLTTYGDAEPLRPSVAGQMPLYSANGQPSLWCIDGANISLNCPCDQAHTFLFRYRKSFTINSTTSTNWLLTNHPDIYLAGTLIWGGLFGKDDPEAAKWKLVLDEGIRELSHEEAANVRIAPLTVDPALVSRGGFNIMTGE